MLAQIVLTLIFYLFLFAILVFSVLIWRDGVKNTVRMQQALIEVAQTSAEAAKTSARAAEEIAAHLATTGKAPGG